MQDFKYQIKFKPYQKLQIMKTHSIIAFILAFLLFQTALSYLQFQLVRIPQQSKPLKSKPISCMTKIQPQAENGKKQKNSDDEDDSHEPIADDDNFKQICYEKDISYAIQLYKNDQRYLLSMDLTTPISWIKGEKCHLGNTKKACSRVEVNLREEIVQFQNKIKNAFHFGKKKKRKQNQYALIEGSSEVVKGIVQKTQNLTFITRDSGRLTRLGDLLLLGLAVLGEKDKMFLKNTKFINATQISPDLNYICDGAISLRFDENSQSSFLKQILQYARTSEEYVTIFLGRNNLVTIGDLSVKNSDEGLSGIRWLNAEQDEEYGKLPRIEKFYYSSQKSEKRKEISVDLPVVFTISSSSIHIPEKELEIIMEKFLRRKKCEINEESRFLECQKLKSSDLEKELNFGFQNSDIMIKLEDLVLKKTYHKTILNIKKALDQKFIILGEPLFKKYFFVLDYKNNRIGISHQRTNFTDQVVNVVTLIRFVVWIIVICILFIMIVCVLICCATPIQKCFGMKTTRYPGAHVKRRKKYSPVEQNPQEEMKGNLGNSVQVSPSFQEVEGI